MLKKKLKAVLETGVLPSAKPKITQEQIESSNKMRSMLSERLNMDLDTFLRTKATLHPKHGIAYKLLKTTPERLRDSTLCSHDVAFWLRNHQNPTAATWVLKLAGPEVGQVSRNQVLQWLRDSGRRKELTTFYNWTRKWGFQDSDVTKTILARPMSVDQARKMYSEFKSGERKQGYGNKLLDAMSKRDTFNAGLRDPEGFYSFFRMLRKDVITFQIMLGAMIRERALRKYAIEVWDLAQRQEMANNMKIDDKLRDTYNMVVSIIEQDRQRDAQRRVIAEAKYKKKDESSTKEVKEEADNAKFEKV